MELFNNFIYAIVKYNIDIGFLLFKKHSRNIVFLKFDVSYDYVGTFVDIRFEHIYMDLFSRK